MAKRVELTVPDELWDRIEKARGYEPRASFIKRLLSAAVVLEAMPSPFVSSSAEDPDPDPFTMERAAVREAVAAGATEVRVVAGSLKPNQCPECERFNGVHAKSCSRHPRNA